MTVCGNSVALPPKAQIVLAFLATKMGQAVPRERLADLAWSRSGPEQARQSLRQALVSIRQSLANVPNARLSANSPENLSLEGARIDLLELERLAKSGDANDLVLAADLYKGPFLSELPSAGEPFEEWRRIEQARVLNLTIGVLTRLTDLRLSAGQFEAAIATGQALVTLDPLREDAHRLLIRAFAQAGRRSEAFRQYDQLCELLRKELGVAPDAATRQLIDSLREAPKKKLSAPVAVEEPAASAALAMLPQSDSAAMTREAIAGPTGPASQRVRVRLALRFAVVVAVVAVAGLFSWPRSPAAGRPLVAVAALAPLSKDEEAKSLASALTARLIGGLGNIPTIRAQASRENTTPDYRIEGTVETGATSTHVEARLINAHTGDIIINSPFEAPHGSPLEMQDEILGRVGRELTEAINRLAYPYPLDTAEKLHAVDLMQSAQNRADAGAPPGPTMALFQEALATDPKNFEIAASYANALIGAASNQYKPSKQQEEYYAAAKAILDKLDTKVHSNRLVAYARCQLFRNIPDLFQALTACESTQKILPWSARVYKELGYVHMLSGQLRGAYEQFKNADRLQRKGAIRWSWVLGGVLTCLLLDRSEEALDWLNTVNTGNVSPKVDLLVAVARHRINSTAPTNFTDVGFFHDNTPDDIINNWFPSSLTYGMEMTNSINRLKSDLQLQLRPENIQH